jgi:hypothetical protein
MAVNVNLQEHNTEQSGHNIRDVQKQRVVLSAVGRQVWSWPTCWPAKAFPLSCSKRTKTLSVNFAVTQFIPQRWKLWTSWAWQSRVGYLARQRVSDRYKR